MDAVFKIKASEFNEALFAKIKSLIKRGDSEIIISVSEGSELSVLDETPTEYITRIKQAATDISAGRGTNFTIDELKSFMEK